VTDHREKLAFAPVRFLGPAPGGLKFQVLQLQSLANTVSKKDDRGCDHQRGQKRQRDRNRFVEKFRGDQPIQPEADQRRSANRKRRQSDEVPIQQPKA